MFFGFLLVMDFIGGLFMMLLIIIISLGGRVVKVLYNPPHRKSNKKMGNDKDQ